MRPAVPGRGRPAGFSLLELLVVMAILGLVVGLFGTRGPPRSAQLNVDTAARELAGALQLARSRAIAQNRVVAVSIGADSYSLDGEAPRLLRAGVAAAAGRSIAFAANGGSSGGAVSLQAGDRQAAVDVEWLTGRVSVTGGR